MRQVFDDPQVIPRGLRLDMDGLKGVRAPFRFSSAPDLPQRPAPIPGQVD